MNQKIYCSNTHHYKYFSERKQLRRLRSRLRKTKKRAFAEGTTRNNLVKWKAFDRFCNKFNLHEWPTSTNTICLFAQYLAKTFRSVKSIESYLYGVVQLHLFAGTTPPNLKDFQVKLTIRGLKRTLKHRVKQAKPMTPFLLQKIHALLNPANQKNIVFWAILITGFHLLLRKSNLVPDTKSSFDPRKQLTRKQVQVKKQFVRIIITWSKTIQFHQKKLILKMYKSSNRILCPVRAFNRLFCSVSPAPDHPCFLCKDGTPFTYNMLQYELKKYLRLAGVKGWSRYSAHSLRRGGLVWGYKIGLSKKFLKSLGDWSSECFERYLAFPREIRDTASIAFRDSLTDANSF